MDTATVPDRATRRWWTLTWLSLTQLMMVVVATVMNVAVPSAERDLGLSVTEREWVITIYLLAFGSLLLLGGRVSDTIGRRRAILIGLTGFAAASVLGGLALDAQVLLTARALQGVFSALVTPSALALISLTFQAGPERAKAFGVFGTIMGAGSGIGVVLGGVLTQTWGWRSAMFINLPIAAVAAAGLLWSLAPDTPGRGRVSILDGLLSVLGLSGITLGLTVAGTDGWAAPSTIALMLLGVLALAAFVRRQRLSAAPLLPLSLFAERRRAAAFVAMLAWGIAIMPVFLFLSVFMQQIAGMGPLASGLAFLPYTAAILVTVRLLRPLNARIPAPTLISAGLVVIAAGLLLLSLLRPDSQYWTQVLPILLLLGIGTATVQPASNSTATYGAGAASGSAGAVASTAQQVGSSLGMALLGSVAATATAAALPAQDEASAVVHGYASAGLAAAVLLLVAAVGVRLLAGRPVRG